MRRALLTLIGFIALAQTVSAEYAVTQGGPSAAQSATPIVHHHPQKAAASTAESPEAQVNHHTIGIISGGLSGTYLAAAAEMASVLDRESLRVLPIVGKGSVQNIYDILYLRGVDVGLVQSDVFDGIDANGRLHNLKQRIHYIAPLFNNEMHIVTTKDVTDIRQLAGRTVSADVVGSGTSYSTKLVFEKLGIAVDIVNDDQATGLEKLRSRSIAAAVIVGGKSISGLGQLHDPDLHLLSVPYDERLQDSYLPAVLTQNDYPNLVAAGEIVTTIAVSTVLSAYNWPQDSEQYQKVARFIDAFFSNFDAFLKPPRHPKWKEVNLAGTIPGWTRFRAAEEWLNRRSASSVRPTAQTEAAFRAFLQERAGSHPQADREQLFSEFLKWQQSRAIAD